MPVLPTKQRRFVRPRFLPKRVFYRSLYFKISVVGAGLLLTATIIYILPLWRINDVFFDEGLPAPPHFAQIESFLEDELLGKNILAFISLGAKKRLLLKFPHISEVILKKRLPNKVFVVLYVREPVLKLSPKTGFSDLLITSLGAVFLDPGDTPILPEFIPTESVNINQGLGHLSPNDSALVSQLVGEVNDLALKEIDGSGTITLADGIIVFLDLKRSLSWQFSQTKEIISQSVLEGKTLSSVDFRYGQPLLK
ncbi:hypothetical protein COT52_03045 [candidate division WWE3 bacterium CG08_land_8_20_14_0_20_43_13]|uniref:POTRA domain-containing protein n=1 Tax=candidate division WWE3 bacterium CG08_land_8_20_14_0_20_43_13 TaxID=1975087 RepID=A0A2H0X6W3_UNCKA|nr:MAG: hypothetical protein COT52_03045 [candidate division WWE3 bacterium CG08_land_8_20_14_0_20_43_13]